MKVVEIFKSIDGEGIRAGLPVTFVRLGGCNLHCSYCDTTYAWQEGYTFKEMTAEEVYDKVYKMGCPRVTITGGEPLIHESLEFLVTLLTTHDFEVNIETNGSIDIYDYVTVNCGGMYHKNIIITMDYKCPSSGMEDKMSLANLGKLRSRDVLKFVVGSKQDLDVCRDIRRYVDCHIFISPIFGKIEPKEIVEYILEHNMQDCRVQLQLHKFIWPPEQRGV